MAKYYIFNTKIQYANYFYHKNFPVYRSAVCYTVCIFLPMCISLSPVFSIVLSSPILYMLLYTSSYFPPFFLHLLLFSPSPLPSSPPLPTSSLPQVLAQGIYDEFQSMVEMYGPESIGNLMPLVVNVLENLDSALADNQVIMWESIMCCIYIYTMSSPLAHFLCNLKAGNERRTCKACVRMLRKRVLKSSQDSNSGLLNGSQILLWSQLWHFMCLADFIVMMYIACV